MKRQAQRKTQQRREGCANKVHDPGQRVELRSSEMGNRKKGNRKGSYLYCPDQGGVCKEGATWTTSGLVQLRTLTVPGKDTGTSRHETRTTTERAQQMTNVQWSRVCEGIHRQESVSRRRLARLFLLI